MGDDPTKLREWEAFYVWEASMADPEVTEWDDDETKRRKLAAAAAAKVRR